MAAIRGNERFQSRVEYSTVVHLYMGDRAHKIMQLLLFCTLQSVNMSSIIIAAQASLKAYTRDKILTSLATIDYGFYLGYYSSQDMCT
jgi:hypothetical protein